MVDSMIVEIDGRIYTTVVCEKCEGDGWLEYEVPVVKPHGEGYLKGVLGECDECDGSGVRLEEIETD